MLEIRVRNEEKEEKQKSKNPVKILLGWETGRKSASGGGAGRVGIKYLERGGM